MHFLNIIEQAGLAGALSKLQTLGVPIHNENAARCVKKCERDGCDTEAGLLFIMGRNSDDDTNQVGKAMCIICVTENGDMSHLQRHTTTSRAGRTSKPTPKRQASLKSRVSQRLEKDKDNDEPHNLVRTLSSQSSDSAISTVPNLSRIVAAQVPHDALTAEDKEPKKGDVWEDVEGVAYTVSGISKDATYIILTPVGNTEDDELVIEREVKISEFKIKPGRGRAAERWLCLKRYVETFGGVDTPRADHAGRSIEKRKASSEKEDTRGSTELRRQKHKFPDKGVGGNPDKKRR